MYIYFTLAVDSLSKRWWSDVRVQRSPGLCLAFPPHPSYVLIVRCTSFLVYYEWVNLATTLLVLGTLFCEHLDCTDSNILFLFPLTYVLIVRCFGSQHLLNALNVNVM